MKNSFLKFQVIPIALTAFVCAALIALLWFEVRALDVFLGSSIFLTVRAIDVAVGIFIYLKTSIDSALYIGSLMSRNPGWKSRIAIEIGTAFGNGIGTLAVLCLWAIFKEFRWLLALMIVVASLVLFKLAEEGFDHIQQETVESRRGLLHTIATLSLIGLQRFNKVIQPVLHFIMPSLRLKDGTSLRFWPLFGLSLTVPFVLGLDDFAGYVPLFNVVNVFGFAIGVFVAHMLLNILLYVSPSLTIRVVKNHFIAFMGSVVFIALGVWGLVEVARLTSM